MIDIVPLAEEHLKDLANLEQECFTVPWTYDMFENELKSPLANYFVAVDGDKVIGYAGMWQIIDEGHITNIAVKKEYRSQKIGSMLLEKLLEVADEYPLSFLTLEVRKSNEKAKRLYHKFGFRQKGTRKKYYSDNHEDAIIMTCFRNASLNGLGG